MPDCLFCGKEATHVIMPRPGVSHPICVHCIITLERLKAEATIQMPIKAAEE